MRDMSTSYMIAVVLGATLIGAWAEASEYFINGKPASKVDAVITLAKDPSAEVVRCQPQELSEKATLRNKKKK